MLAGQIGVLAQDDALMAVCIGPDRSGDFAPVRHIDDQRANGIGPVIETDRITAARFPEFLPAAFYTNVFMAALRSPNLG
jgi:hypothetical protein